MPRKKKDVQKVTYTLAKEVTELIDKYSEATDIPKSKIIEKSVKSYVGRNFAKLEKEYGKMNGESFGWIDD